MLQICILSYIIVELFEWSSTLYGINGSKQGLTKFQYRVYILEITYSYALSIIFGSVGLWLMIKFVNLNDILSVIGCLFAIMWIRDIIGSFLDKILMRKAYKWYQTNMIKSAKKKVK